MTRPLITLSALLVPALIALAPSPASAEPGARAVSRCQADMLARFEPGAVRSYRIASIAQSARRVRVNFYVTTDQRRAFECTVNLDGRILTASFDPPIGGRDRRLASSETGQSAAQPR